MNPAKRELEVVVRSRPSEHDPVESFVVGESSNLNETEAFAVHFYRFFQLSDRPSDAGMTLHGYDSDRLNGAALKTTGPYGPTSP